MRTTLIRSLVIVVLCAMVLSIGVLAQAPPAGGGQGGGRGGAGGGGGRGPAGPAFTVTSSAWPDGDVVPAKHAGRGGNMSPAFEFNWVQGGNPAMPPATLMSYAIVMH